MKIEKNNPIVSYIYILIALFILVLGTKNMAYGMMQKMDERELLQVELEEKREKLNKLNDINVSLKKNTDIIKKYNIEVSEDKLIEYFYTYAQGLPVEQELLIKSLSMSPVIKNELGFNEMRIGLNVKVSDQLVLENFFNYLTKENAQYSFFVDSFTYPNDGRNDGYIINIPLKLLFR